MSRIAVITVAGISSRFNRNIDEEDKVLKCLYTEGDAKDTLLYRMIQKLSYADQIIVVGGYKFDDLRRYVDSLITDEFRQKITLVYNDHYEDLSSGYSLYLGLEKVLEDSKGIEDVLFVEGDLEIDKDSLDAVIAANTSVLTYNYEPIKADKAVVLYVDEEGRYRYAFNSSHGLLTINSPFSAIYNSGQTWKFTDMNALKAANDLFVSEHREETNLAIIQEYLNRIPIDDVSILPLRSWTNCNIREDYKIIKERWNDENA